MLAGGGQALWAAVKIEAQPVARRASHAPFERLPLPPPEKDAVLHVGAEGEVPDLVGGAAFEPQPPAPVPEAGQRPDAQDDRNPEAFQEAAQRDHAGTPGASREMRSSNRNCSSAARMAATKTAWIEISETRPAPSRGSSAAGEAIALR